MRVRANNDQISVHAIAGTNVVLFGLDVHDDAREGLLGFAIHRSGGKGKPYWLRGGRLFEGQSKKTKGESRDSRTAPIQAFLWSDFSAHPGESYTYTVHPVYGTRTKPTLGPGLKVAVETEDHDDGAHGIYFNRAIAGSQSYSRHFGDAARYYPPARGDWWPMYIRPEDVEAEGGNAWGWLSRGLDRAMLDFIGQAKGKRYALHAAVFEFTYAPVLQAFVDALESGADVQVIHHAKHESQLKLTEKEGSTAHVIGVDGRTTNYNNKAVSRVSVPDGVCSSAQRAMDRVGVRDWKNVERRKAMMIPRTNVGALSHNKFIVLLEDGKPAQVWTGSTNFTKGGIFGQSNVGHVIHDEKIAKAYHRYWKALLANEKKGATAEQTTKIQKDLPDRLPRKGMTPIFSPRPSVDMLKWYGERLQAAKHSVHMTAAFGVSQDLAKYVRDPKDEGVLRYVLLDQNKPTKRNKAGTTVTVGDLQARKWNQIVWGDVQKRVEGDDHLVESLTGLNTHVSYVHTKFMLIDALTDDPIVITGSANFSKNSTVDNDENMVVIRGDTRVADIYLTEFMRFFKHFYYRNEERKRGGKDETLTPDNSWTKPFFKPEHPLCEERMLYR